MHAQMPPGAPEILRTAVIELQGRRA
jgi:hypothetical protein